ncbi:MAG: hypothetical protein K2X34_03490, partial [Hyphomonadaceae bacterium]|nr:hypothetical protein [Hyphomonadaceae bacterium]
MIQHIRAALVCGLALLLSAPAVAQNLSLRAPTWAQPLIASDIITTTGGRAALAADGIEVAVRVSIMPPRGGVARVIRYEQRADGTTISLRRFTGHPSTGWWLWGPDYPLVTQVAAAPRAQVNTIAREVMG